MATLFGQACLEVPPTGPNLANALRDMRKAWVTKNSVDGTEATLKPEKEQVRLTYEEMNYAIANSGAMPN